MHRRGRVEEGEESEGNGRGGEGSEEAGGMGLMVWTDVAICACAQFRDTEGNKLRVSEGGEVG